MKKFNLSFELEICYLITQSSLNKPKKQIRHITEFISQLTSGGLCIQRWKRPICFTYLLSIFLNYNPRGSSFNMCKRNLSRAL